MHISAFAAHLYNGLRGIKIIPLSRNRISSFEELDDLYKSLHRGGIFVDRLYKKIRRKNSFYQ